MSEFSAGDAVNEIKKIVSVVVCDYCDGAASHVTGKTIYPHRPDLADKQFFLCVPCAAYVGCHPGTDKPLGRLANANLRKWKQRVHAAFDPIWRTGYMDRKKAYAVLAEKLGIPEDECHIGMFDEEMCQRVVELCEGFNS